VNRTAHKKLTKIDNKHCFQISIPPIDGPVESCWRRAFVVFHTNLLL